MNNLTVYGVKLKNNNRRSASCKRKISSTERNTKNRLCSSQRSKRIAKQSTINLQNCRLWKKTTNYRFPSSSYNKNSWKLKTKLWCKTIRLSRAESFLCKGRLSWAKTICIKPVPLSRWRRNKWSRQPSASSRWSKITKRCDCSAMKSNNKQRDKRIKSRFSKNNCSRCRASLWRPTAILHSKQPVMRDCKQHLMANKTTLTY